MSKKRETVYSGNQFGRWPPENLMEFVKWLDGIVKSIPVEHLTEAKIEIDSETNYDLVKATMEISYWRPESEAERGYKAQKERAAEKARRDQELATLAALKAKYEK